MKNPFNNPLTLHNGTAFINGQPVFFNSADYPYYRDDALNWRTRLQSLKAMGVKVISSYIPWRHHQLFSNMEPDFNGRTQPNRDVLKFISLCSELDLALIAKPGPFIHAEINYGGLPDWTCPLYDPAIEPLSDSTGKPCLWNGSGIDKTSQKIEKWPLPAPFSPKFLQLTRQWLSQVGKQVIQPFETPQGPIVAVQIGNEGIYSNGQHAPWAYDYSRSALEMYKRFLDENHRDLKDAPTHWNFPTNLDEMHSFVDWGEFQAWYLHKIFKEWYASLETSLPLIVNQNPPLDAPYGVDAWFTRVEPEVWQGFHYGITNWVGDVSAKPSSFHRYAIAAKRYRGINMEENWSFGELYDPSYIDPATCFYETFLILNSGATGFNIYTGVGTNFADANLDVMCKNPYPDCPPITENGLLTPKASIASWIIKFLGRYGTDFIESQPVQPVAWGFYLPWVRIAVWAVTENDSHIPSHGKFLSIFQEQTRKNHLDYAILNLESEPIETLLRYPDLFVAAGNFMGKTIQDKLFAYIQAGGNLTWLGELPKYDEQGNPYSPLAMMSDNVHLANEVDLSSILQRHRAPVVNGKADIWIRSHPQKDLHFVTILIPADGQEKTEIEFTAGTRHHLLQLSAAPSGGAVLCIENGKLIAYLIKGLNQYLGFALPPYCILDGKLYGKTQPGDVIKMDGWEDYLLEGGEK